MTQLEGKLVFSIGLDSIFDNRLLFQWNCSALPAVSIAIAIAQSPDLFHLQEQQYNLMAKDYRAKQHEDFPLSSFSEWVYQMRLKDEYEKI